MDGIVLKDIAVHLRLPYPESMGTKKLKNSRRRKVDPYRIAAPSEGVDIRSWMAARAAAKKAGPTYDRIMATAGGADVLAAIERDGKQSRDALKAALAHFDQMGGFPAQFDVGKDRTEGDGEGEWIKGEVVILDDGGIPKSWPFTGDLRADVDSALDAVAEDLEMKEQLASAARRLAARPPLPASAGARQAEEKNLERVLADEFGIQPKTKQPAATKRALAMTPDAIRKRMERAAGKVKPRPSRRKAARTPEQWAAAAVKAAETRRADLTKLEAAYKAGKVPEWRMQRAWKSYRASLSAAETWKKRASKAPNAKSRK
jgi:hypothetical protein